MKFDKETVSKFLEIATNGSSWLHIIIPKVNESLIQKGSETRSDKWADIICHGGSLIVDDMEDDSEYTFNRLDMISGMAKLKNDYSEEAANISNDEADFTDCDIYMQYVIFGEYVYG